MTDTESHYQDILLRWLKTKRDYPWNSEPEPPRPPELSFRTWNKIRTQTMREFQRTQP